MLTGHGSFDLAVSGMRLGAFDYLMKPCDISQLLEKWKTHMPKSRQWKKENAQTAKTEQTHQTLRF
ncbi:MAG: hypothetical protein R2861_00175 [Desulfobacterales bacterium]